LVDQHTFDDLVHAETSDADGSTAFFFDDDILIQVPPRPQGGLA
jgi:hypothetical protein